LRLITHFAMPLPRHFHAPPRQADAVSADFSFYGAAPF